MTPWNSANLGDSVSSIDTPALILDLDAFERNIELMASALKEKGIRLRAHAKSHKCPEIAKIQIAKGAVGICCQKVSEAAVFVEAGIKDLLVTNQIISSTKVKRLFELARSARMGILVDHPKQVAVLLAQARVTGLEIDVYVEVNVGSNRCGLRFHKIRDLLKILNAFVIVQYCYPCLKKSCVPATNKIGSAH